jgi:hypothetical protein
MKNRRTSCSALIMLLVASAACYVDLPRLHVVRSLGDTLNAARMLDVISHIRLARQTGVEVATQFDEGRRSLDLINANPRLPVALPARLQYRVPRLAAQGSGEFPPGAYALLCKPPVVSELSARPPPRYCVQAAGPAAEAVCGVQTNRGPPARV